jgi:arylsulfatase G
MIILWGGVYDLLTMLMFVCATERDIRPNIVIIMADDMGWGDVGANWPEAVHTPTVDSLAREGLRLVRMHLF